MFLGSTVTFSNDNEIQGLKFVFGLTSEQYKIEYSWFYLRTEIELLKATFLKGQCTTYTVCIAGSHYSERNLKLTRAINFNKH